MSGSLAFRYFPASQWRPSGVNVEFDPSQANTATQIQRALLIGQILAGGTATANTPILAYSQDQVNGLCGANSMLALMYSAYRAQDPFGEVWLGPVADNGAGTAGVGTIVLAGTATAAGTLYCYVMGVLVPVSVAVGDTASVVGGNLATAVNAATGICATAANGTGTVTFTARHKGAWTNDIDLRLNYRGAANNEVLPAGITASFGTAVAGTTAGCLATGATNPTMTTLLTNCGMTTFDFIALPYTDSASLTALQSFLSDTAGRWSGVSQLYGHVFSAYRGTVSARGSFGVGRNDQHATILGFFDSPTPAWIEAADLAAVHARTVRVNPAVGVTGLPLALLPPPLNNQDTPGNRNTLLFDGLSTFYVDAAGQSRIDRSITTYQFNAASQPDNSYLNTNMMFQAMYAARYIITQLTSQFVSAGKILVSDGTPIGPGSPATTPSAILGSAVAIYAYLCSIFITQNPDAFSRNAYATKGTKGQVLLYLPIDFSDQVINVAALIQFQQST